MNISRTIGIALCVTTLMLSGCQFIANQDDKLDNDTSHVQDERQDKQQGSATDSADDVGQAATSAAHKAGDEQEQPSLNVEIVESDDGYWSLEALEQIAVKTQRLFRVKPEAESDVILRYSEIILLGQYDTRRLCGYLRPENSKMDNGYDFPFIIDHAGALSINARATKSAAFERKWQQLCTQQDQRQLPLTADKSTIQIE